MDTILARRSSTEVWAHLARTGRRPLARPAASTARPRPCKTADAEAVARRLPFLSRPIELVVPDAGLRRATAGTTTFVNKGIRHPDARWPIGGGIGTESPAACLAQFAGALCEAELIELACAMAGRYCFAAKPSGSIIDAVPLISIAAMRSFLQACSSATGSAKALRALSWAIDGLGSPYETLTYLLLCLPPRFGGWHLPKPVANGRIEVANRRKRGVAQNAYYPDLWWPEANLVVEYDSREYHGTPDQAERDGRRRNDLQSLGLHVVIVNRRILKDPVLLENTYEQLRRTLGVARPRQTQSSLARRHQLRKTLLGPNSPGVWR